MAIIPDKGAKTAEILINEVTINAGRPAEYTDMAALKLVVQDAARTDAWLAEKQWSLHWRETDILYQSPRNLSAWEGTTVTRANVSRFTVASHVNSIQPQMMSGIFYEDPPFVLRPRPRTKQNVVKAKTALFSMLLAEMNFQQECDNGTLSQVNFGTGVWKWGWTTELRTKKKYVRKTPPARVKLPFSDKEILVHTKESDEFEVQEVQTEKNRPFLESKDIRFILPDPAWNSPDIRDAKWVVERAYLTFNDLEELRNQPGYDLPPSEDLKALFFGAKEIPLAPGTVEQNSQGNVSVMHAAPRNETTTADPLEQPLEVLERWDHERVIVVIQQKLIIRNEAHGLGCHPYLSSNWWNVPNCGWGMGVGRIVGQDQRVEQGATNGALDILALACNQQYARSRGANVPTQQIRSRLGGIIDVDGDVDKAFKVIEPPRVPPELWTAIESSKASGQAASGANELFMQGNLPEKGRTSLGRTARGAGEMAGAVASRLQGPVGRFVNQVFIPFLKIMDELIAERMPISELREMLGDKMGPDFQESETFMEEFLNADMEFEALAGAHLAAKKAMAAALPLLVQIFENPHLLQQLQSTGWTVDVRELFDMMMEMSEWKNDRDVIRQMTKQELALYQAANQAIQKVQGAMALQDKKHQGKAQEIDQENEAHLARDLVLQSADRATSEVMRSDFREAVQ